MSEQEKIKAFVGLFYALCDVLSKLLEVEAQTNNDVLELISKAEPVVAHNYYIDTTVKAMLLERFVRLCGEITDTITKGDE